MQRRKVRTWPLRVLALLCALTFLFSAFMTGTYAWDSDQKALNNLYGTKDAMIPVELIKLEKTADGTETEKPIANTMFYLYRESGEQIGSRYVTDPNGKINVNLPIGNYYFEEILPSIGYTYDTDSTGKPVTRYYFAVVEQGKAITVKAYNKHLDGDLLIRKTVENTDGTPLSEIQQKTSFEFTVTFSDGGSYTYKIDGGEEKTLTSGQTLRLCSGQTAVFEDLPFGVLYNVIETPVAGYTIAGTGHRGNITETQSVADFINRCDTSKLGSLIVSKDVQGKGADLNKQFTFTASIGNVTETFTLKHGKTKEFTGIPVGTEYTVTEQPAINEGYTATVAFYTGRILATEAVTLPFVNVYNETPPTSQNGSLSVFKTVIGNNADKDKKFTFKVIFDGVNAPEDQTFTLKAGESKTFKNIPAGVSYTVTETDAAGYEAVVDTANGVIAGEQTASVVLINKVPEIPTPDKKIKLTVQKLLVGELLESDKERQFNITLTVDGKATAFALKANEIKEFEISPGAVYDVSEENYIKDGFSQSIVNGSGIAGKELTEVVVTNTYVGQPRIEISGQKTWDKNGCENVTLPKSITVRLKNGDTLVEKLEVKPGADNLWKYSFIVPKYNADGSEAVYTLEEDAVAGFRVSYEGYNIINTYVKPIEVDPPIITKVVQGENAPKTAFEFVFTGQHGTPMPEGSVSYRKALTLTGAGELEIGTITYDKAGTYVYTVHEQNGGAQGWKYDASLYTITVVVTETNFVLSAKTTVDKLGTATESIVFTNSFEPKDDETVIISGTKTWNYAGSPENERPTSIIVEVYANGKLASQHQITAEDNWQYSFELPRYNASGNEIFYTIDEADVAGYKKTIDGYDLINTYIGTPNTPNTPDTPDDPVDTPQTGDNSNIAFWIMLMILSFIGLVITLLGIKQYVYAGKHSYRPRHSKWHKN